MWVWLDCGACMHAPQSNRNRGRTWLDVMLCGRPDDTHAGRPDDTHAGACSCTMWVECKTTVRQTANRQHIEKSTWASAAQHSTKPLWPVWDLSHRQCGCGYIVSLCRNPYMSLFMELYSIKKMDSVQCRSTLAVGDTEIWNPSH